MCITLIFTLQQIYDALPPFEKELLSSCLQHKRKGCVTTFRISQISVERWASKMVFPNLVSFLFFFFLLRVTPVPIATELHNTEPVNISKDRYPLIFCFVAAAGVVIRRTVTQLVLTGTFILLAASTFQPEQFCAR